MSWPLFDSAGNQRQALRVHGDPGPDLRRIEALLTSLCQRFGAVTPMDFDVCRDCKRLRADHGGSGISCGDFQP